ncbi:hypothetical protein PG991_011814 [Apiospora marii]|uniref:F-box domain-containing protein n=1 Tax=Apiospora marii TaxID=335849 RepID=A0ABR1RF90_9PEZI
MSQSPLMSLPVEIRVSILNEAITNLSYHGEIDLITVRALMETCKAISDELFPILFDPNGYISSVNLAIRRSGYASTSWLMIEMSASTRLPNPMDWPSFTRCTFFIRDLEDQKLKSLVHRAYSLRYFHVVIDVPQLAAKGLGKSEDLAVIWSKVRDIATLIALFRSVVTVTCTFDLSHATALDYHRFFHCPVNVNQETFRNSLCSLIVGALTDPFIKNSSFSKHRTPTAPHFEFRCWEARFWNTERMGGWDDHQRPERFCHDAARIVKTVQKGLCTPQSLPKRFLEDMMNKQNIFALTSNEVIELRHEMRTLSIAVDALIDTCRGRAANMLRLHRFATWDSPETNGMSLAAQHNLLRGVGPQDRTISNRETLMKIMKPAECDISGYPVDTWYNKYPQGIEPLDLLAKRHRECFEEEPEFEVQEITHTKE